MSIALITHFDLDACSAQIIAKHVFDIDKAKCQGYGKVRRNLEQLVADGYDALVCTDLSMERDDLIYATENFKAVIYFDHHESSEAYVALAKEIPNLEVIFDKNFCAATLVFQYGVAKGRIDTSTELGRGLANLAKNTDVFDLWKTNHDSWNLGYSLNTLFWELGFWEFEKRFANGYLYGLTDDEMKLCATLKNARLAAIENAPSKELGTDNKLVPSAVIIAFEDSTAVSDVSLTLDYDIYMIVYYNRGEMKLSVRAKDHTWKHINVNTVLQKIDNDLISAAGGHRLAGGITLSREIGLQDAIVFLETVVYDEFKNFLVDEEIPF